MRYNRRVKASIVIPTYQRAAILDECLDRLQRQRLDSPDDRLEVIVVNDGSRDDTEAVVRRHIDRGALEIRLISKDNEGQGIARNVGVAAATGDIIIFIGDDILVGPEFVAQHLRAHRQHPRELDGVLGFIEWDSRIERTPFTTFLTNGSLILGRFGGHQFAYEKLRGRPHASYHFFYTSNISLKRSLISNYPFDPTFRGYGWEDIELGYRLEQAGFVLHYHPEIVGEHYHPMDESSLERRMFAIGKAAVLFQQRHPAISKIPSWWKRLILAAISSKPLIAFFNWARRGRGARDRSSVHRFGGDQWHYWYYYIISKRHYLRGLREGIRIFYNGRAS